MSYGTHARLKNISDDHKWIKTEKFKVGLKEKVHYAGDSAGNTMYNLVELRKQKPSLFEGLDIMQQPAAYVDEIIHAWALEHLSESFPCSLWQRDALATHCSEAAAKSCFWSQCLQCLIGGKMTAVMQLCDTDFSFLLKKSIRNRIANSTGSSGDQHPTPSQSRVFHWEYTLSTISINWIASSTPQASIR